MHLPNFLFSYFINKLYMGKGKKKKPRLIEKLAFCWNPVAMS